MTPPAAQLQQLARDIHAAGADVVKIATMANDITDSAAVLSLLDNPPGVWKAHTGCACMGLLLFRVQPLVGSGCKHAG